MFISDSSSRKITSLQAWLPYLHPECASACYVCIGIIWLTVVFLHFCGLLMQTFKDYFKVTLTIQSRQSRTTLVGSSLNVLPVLASVWQTLIWAGDCSPAGSFNKFDKLHFEWSLVVFASGLDSLTDLKPTAWDGAHTWRWFGGQVPEIRWASYLGGRPNTTFLLKEH